MTTSSLSSVSQPTTTLFNTSFNLTFYAYAQYARGIPHIKSRDLDFDPFDFTPMITDHPECFLDSLTYNFPSFTYHLSFLSLHRSKLSYSLCPSFTRVGVLLDRLSQSDLLFSYILILCR